MRPDGTSVWVINTVSLVRDTDNRPVYTAVIVFDVTSRKTGGTGACRTAGARAGLTRASRRS
ncbi:hypothetical protein ACFS07_16185 [Undibacterium arcticum]